MAQVAIHVPRLGDASGGRRRSSGPAGTWPDTAAAALAQFDAYLSGGGHRLAAEALFGRGRALQALGHSTQEAQNWKRLIKQYPNSAYAAHAQRRLDQLRQGTSG